jgi:hypothetical protein
MIRPLLMLCAVLTVGAASAAQPLGRFFFTPAERAQLDQARAQKQRPTQAGATEAATAPPATQVVTYSGIVRRSDGKSILWLNNGPQEEQKALSGLPVRGRVGADGAVTLEVPHTSRTVQLKVGQRAELQTGTVAEARENALSPATAATPPQEAMSDKKTQPAMPGVNPAPASSLNPENRDDQRARASPAK